MTQRAYQSYQTKSIYHCNGRCVSGPLRGQYRATLGLFLIPSAIFFAFVAPWIFINISPIMVAFSIFFAVFGFVNLMLSAYRDPGIIPKNPQEVQTKGRSNHRTVTIRGTKVQMRYCVTCHIFRPPRSTHCSTCDNCVERFDHHCAWIGNCVGSRNYHTFFYFVLSVVISLILVEVSCILQIAFEMARQVSKHGFWGGLGAALSMAPPNNIIFAFLLALYSLVGIGPIGFFARVSYAVNFS